MNPVPFIILDAQYNGEYQIDTTGSAEPGIAKMMMVNEETDELLYVIRSGEYIYLRVNNVNRDMEILS